VLTTRENLEISQNFIILENSQKSGQSASTKTHIEFKNYSGKMMLSQMVTCCSIAYVCQYFWMQHGCYVRLGLSSWQH